MGRMSRLFRWPRRTHQPPAPQPRPNPDRIAILEHDLLGITPEPGTPAARAVALSKPVDQNACPHEDVIETRELGQARTTGMCRRCGADMVETDTGDWERP
jgi:hypothetical protein